MKVLVEFASQLKVAAVDINDGISGLWEECQRLFGVPIDCQKLACAEAWQGYARHDTSLDKLQDGASVALEQEAPSKEQEAPSKEQEARPKPKPARHARVRLGFPPPSASAGLMG